MTYVDVAYSLGEQAHVRDGSRTGPESTRPQVCAGSSRRSRQLPKKITSLGQLKIVDPPKSAGKLAYPIVTFTYVIAPTGAKERGRPTEGRLLGRDTGTEVGPPLLFQPLPVPVQAFAFREIKKIQAV